MIAFVFLDSKELVQICGGCAVRLHKTHVLVEEMRGTLDGDDFAIYRLIPPFTMEDCRRIMKGAHLSEIVA